jgi:predicted ATPase
MKLRAFHVTNFRNIVDSGEIGVEDDVTCLVGKNESGKTALLQALYRVNPAYAASFNVSEHYPRQNLVAHRREGDLDEAVAVRATFELAAADLSVIETRFGEGVVPSRTLMATSGYGLNSGLLSVSEPAAISAFVDRVLDLNESQRSELVAVKTLTELRDLCEAKIAVAAPATVGYPAALAPHVQSYRDVLHEIGDTTTHQELLNAVWALLRPRIPRFFYFSRYNYLPGRIDLDAVATAPTEPAEDSMQTARALLKLAGTTPLQLAEEDYEERRAELEAVSNDLTQQMREYWHQSEELEIAVDVEWVNRERLNGQVSVAKALNVRVNDRRHNYSNNLDDRSSGFRWFFSFLAAFSEFEDLGQSVIILLDEPALSLHGRAQADFLRFIDDRIAFAGQVIYTTHSPFLVQPGALHRVRIVEDKGGELGSVTSADVLSVDPDSLSPLQGALGYEIAKGLFLGPDTLLVESTSDLTYLTLLSDHLREIGREALRESWKLVPTGGAQNIAAFVALLGALDVTVLFATETNGHKRLTDLADRELLEASRLISVAAVLGVNAADIEDVFTVADYLKLYNLAFETSFQVATLPAGDRIVQRIATATGRTGFPRSKPADVLLHDRAHLSESFSNATLDRFELIFQRVNATRVPRWRP